MLPTCSVICVHQVNRLSLDQLETVLQKAALLMCRTTNDEVSAVATLCKVSHIWWHAIRNGRTRMRATLQQSIDSESTQRSVLR